MMRAVQGQYARRGGASARGQSCRGEVEAHRSKERVSAHALRVRWETKGVRTLNQGAIAPRLRTDRQSPEAPCQGPWINVKTLNPSLRKVLGQRRRGVRTLQQLA